MANIILPEDEAVVPRITTDVDHYDPERGLKTIAAAEAAENFYRRAKDPEKLYEAVEAKLAEQRRFVLWWDEQEKNPGNQGAGRGNIRPSQADDGLTAESLGLNRDTIHRWRKRLKEEPKFVKALESAKSRCLKVVESSADASKSEAHVSQNEGQSEWYTPKEYIDAAVVVMGGIDLDPASTETANEVVRAVKFYSLRDDGLKQPWFGRVWMNPPYTSTEIPKFIEKLADSVEADAVESAIVLVNNATETGWFFRLISVSSAVVFPRGRVRFWSPDRESAPLQGQAVAYCGKEPEKFLAEFGGFGWGAVL